MIYLSTLVKYRVHEVAKDFGIASKVIMEILTEYATTPKNHMQVLEDAELDLIFEYLTQHHQMENLADIYSVEPAAEAKAPTKEPKAAKAAEASAASGTGRQGKDAPKEERADARPRKAEAAAKGDAGKAETSRSEAAKSDAQRSDALKAEGSGAEASGADSARSEPGRAEGAAAQDKSARTSRKRVVDTSGVTINIEKYDERFDTLAGQRGEKAQNMKRGKEKIQKKGGNRTQSAGNQSAKRRQEERDRMQRLQFEVAKKAPVKVQIPDEISVGELASRMKKTGAETVKQLIKLGVMASLSDVIDYDTAALAAMELGCKVEREVHVTIEERLIDVSEDSKEDLQPRAPVVVVMGHVDHGKTSLLDKIRSSNVASGEAGGITQHIGAYRVMVNGNPVTFLDTPGHEAFTSMRARGAMATDIAILVVAADDGIMPQTVESINHAKAAKIPIVVAINKMDKPGANPERIKQQLTEYDIVPEEWGGDTIVCPISAKTGEGIPELLENLVVLAEVQELRANPNRAARGVVIEARLDKGRGPIMTVLVQNGTLHVGDIIIAGTAVGRVRTMINDKGERVTDAGPSVPVEIAGMNEVSSAGDIFNAVADERMARELAEQRKQDQKNKAGSATRKVSLEDLFAQIKEGELKDLNLIVKADVQGSAEAIKTSLEKLSNDEVRVKVIHSGVGAITESDVMLASTSDAIIVGFNVRPEVDARENAHRSGVDIRLYSVIYDCIGEIESAMKGMLSPKYRESVLGHAQVRETYKVSKVGTVCGCYVQDGRIQRGSQVRVLRDNVVQFDGALASLRRFKDDVREVASGYECGIQVEKFNDVKVGDIIECYVMEQVQQ